MSLPGSARGQQGPGALLWLLLLAFALHSSWVLLRWGTPAMQPWLDNLLYLSVMYLSAAICALAAARTGPASRRAWRWLALSLFLNGLGETTYAALDLRLGEVPTPSAADALFLLGFYPAFALGCLSLPRARLGRMEALRLLLDVGVVVGAVGVLAWYAVLAGLFADTSVPVAERLVNAAYPAFDLALLSLLLLLAHRRGRLGLSEAVLLGALGCFIAGEFIYQLLSSLGAEAYGKLTDVLWSGGVALLGLAAQVATRPPGPGGRLSLALAELRRASRLSPYAPYWALALCCALLYETRGVPTLQAGGVFWGTVLVITLVALRQSAALAENARLASDLSAQADQLESRVQARTAELHQANHALQTLTGDLEGEVQRRTAELESSRASLAHQAQHDALTGLPNRTLFEDRLGQAIARAARADSQLAVLFLDLDGFKHVNDTLGHAAGDALLIEMAQRLQRLLRASDTVARLGGDEFMLLLTELPEQRAVSKVAHKVLEVVARPHDLQGRSVRVSGSIGVSLYPQDGQDVATLHMHADIAMYQAKQAGKADVRFFAPAMNVAARERLELETLLRCALERAELSLHYQPLFQASGGRPLGFEALLRWHSPELGPVSPERFIPVAEDSGLIVPIGEWVLNEACAQLARWQAAGHAGLQMAVNVSPLQFARHDFVQTVQAALGRHGVRGADLELELTERMIVDDPAQVALTLGALQALGVGIAIDDFGAGHSALSSLLQLPVQTLKIDRSFVQDVAGAQRVIQAIVSLAHALGLGVVAEGIETPEQLRRIGELGCERAQGFLMGRPLPAAEATQLLRSGGGARAEALLEQ